jgi:hypothetical protein
MDSGRVIRVAVLPQGPGDEGLLPVGIHKASVKEIRKRFGSQGVAGVGGC